MTSAKDVGAFLENQARVGQPITYQEVLNRFQDLPPFNGIWTTHPLCWLFGELDEQDQANLEPLRTALVYAKETSIPGNGFFDTLANYRNITIKDKQKLELWTAEVNAVIAQYQGK